MKITELSNTEYPPYTIPYINRIDKNRDLKKGLTQLTEESQFFFNEIPTDKLNYTYAENKWSIKEVLQHLIDTERIFAYRMLRIGRGDMTPLASFDQDIYISSLLLPIPNLWIH